MARIEHPAPEGFPWLEAPGEIAEIAQKLRKDAGFKDEAERRAA